MLVVHVLPLSC